MEKTLEKGRLPQIDSIEGLARFWDTHDLTDFEGDLEELREPVFVRAEGRVLTVSLKASEAQRLKRIASDKGCQRYYLATTMDRRKARRCFRARSTA